MAKGNGDKISIAAAKAARIKGVERMAAQGKIGIREAMELVKKIDPSLYPSSKNVLPKKNSGGISTRKQRQKIEEDKKRKQISNRIEDTFKRNGDIGASPAEKRDKKFIESEERRKERDKQRGTDLVKKSKTNGTYKKRPFKKGKSEQERGLERVEQIKKQQAADDAAFKKRVQQSKENRAAGQSVLKKGIRKNKQFIGKKMNMGGVMKNRGGTFKGTF